MYNPILNLLQKQGDLGLRLWRGEPNSHHFLELAQHLQAGVVAIEDLYYVLEEDEDCLYEGLAGLCAVVDHYLLFLVLVLVVRVLFEVSSVEELTLAL
jgi:hypothetical protein